MPNPPRIARALLALTINRHDRRFALSDLAEEHKTLCETRGPLTANRWYWSQVFRSIGPNLLRRSLRSRKVPTRPTQGIIVFESTWQDIRFAVKAFSRSPGFFVVALATLALGIGVNTAAFSLVNSVLLHPLPFDNAELLVEIEAEGDQMGASLTTAPQPEMIAAWLEEAESFEAIGLFGEKELTYSGGEEPEILAAATMSPNLMNVLRVFPRLGRTFVSEDLENGEAQVVLLSEGFWKSRFGSNPNILGQSLTLDGIPRVVIGIVPVGVERLFGARFFVGPQKQIWLPLSASSIRTWVDSPFVIARLKPNVSTSEAQAELDVIQAGLTAAGLNEDNWSPLVSSASGMINGRLPTVLWVLLGSVAIVLLIGCSNIANMLMARGLAREHEFALRSALGASRLRVTRQLLIEGLLLSTLGAALGILLTYWVLDAVVGLATADIRELGSVRIDPIVLVFTACISLVTATVFTLVPAAQLKLSGLANALRSGCRTGTPSSRSKGVRQGFVVAEVAMALVLFVGAGLLLNSFLHLSRVDPGFNPTAVVALALDLPETRYPETLQRSEFFEAVASRIRQLPRTQDVALARGLPPDVPWLFGTVEIEGQDDVNDESPLKAGNWISPGYLRTIGASLREGRAFTELDSDDESAPVIVNEALAEKLWPEGGAVGATIRLDLPFQSNFVGEHRVVGIANTVKAFGLGDEADRMQVYFPFGSYGQKEGIVVARTAGDPNDIIPQLKEQVWAVDPDLPITRVILMERDLSDNIARPRFNALLLSSFALLALFLAVIGVYAVTSLAARQRTREIGVRVALGAKRSDILRLMVTTGMKPIAIGIVVGLGIAVVSTRVLQSLLFEIRPTDPTTYVIVTPLLALVGFVACYLPSLRATRVDPVEVLRQE